jgi:hypothetical protein
LTNSTDLVEAAFSVLLDIFQSSKFQGNFGKSTGTNNIGGTN